MPRALSTLLALLMAVPPSFASSLEAAAVRSGARFDGTRASSLFVTSGGAVIEAGAPGRDLALEALAEGDLSGARAIPEPDSSEARLGRWPVGHTPKGIGPVSTKKRPGYWRGLLGGLLGFLLAPLAFLVEAVQAVALSPVRMVKGVIEGRPMALLDPLRTVKNLLLDAAATGVGMLNSLSAPVWNALRPDESTDFMYVKNRMVFYGGPVAGILKGTDYAKAIAPTWHSVFVTRNREKTRLPEGRNVFEHEFVHNKQIGRSFIKEHVGEEYEGYEGWNDDDAHTYLNLF